MEVIGVKTHFRFYFLTYSSATFLYSLILLGVLPKIIPAHLVEWGFVAFAIETYSLAMLNLR